MAARVELVGSGAVTADDDTASLIDSLDAENEQYMRVTMDLRNLLEDAVIREVALERENAVLRKRVDELESGLEAVMQTKVVRFSGPLRKVWTALREAARRG